MPVSFASFPSSLADGVPYSAAATLLPAVGLAFLEHFGVFGRVLARWSGAAPARPAESVDELYQRGLAARESGRAATAVKAFQDVVRRAPTHAEAHTRLSELAHERGDRASALLHALQAWREDPQVARALAAAAAYRAAGRGADSIALYHDVLGRDADHPGALRHLRDALGELGRFREAVAPQERLVRLAPPDERAVEQAMLAAIHYEVGADRLRHDDAPGAIAALRESLRVRADFLPASVALGDAHVRAGEPGQALRVWERALDGAPALPLLSRLEQAYRAEGRPRRMISLYEQAVARAPEDLALAVALGRVYFELSMLDEAADQLEKVEVRAADLPVVHAYLGAVFERRGQAREALDEYRRALELTQGFQWPHRCAACGASHAGWADRCPSCRRWNTLQP